MRYTSSETEISTKQKSFPFVKQGSVIILLLFFNVTFCNSLWSQEMDTKPGVKKRYFPPKIWMVPEGNDFNNDEHEFSYKRMVESNNIAILWSKEFGPDLSKNADPALRLDIGQVLKECDRFYNFYVDTLGFVNKGNSVTDRYKLLIFVFKGKEGTAFGGGEENKIGIAWTPLARISKAPFGALSHEIGHSFQYLVNAD